MTDQKTNQRLSPKRAIIVYHDNSRQNFYLESREIKSQDGKLSLMTAMPLADNVLKEVARSYMKSAATQMAHSRLISPSILHGSNKPGTTMVMWYRPAMERSLNFSASLKIKGSKPVLVPATLYLVINNKLYLYALMNDDRPALSTKLYKAPYFNIYEDGNVCLGTAPIGRRKGRTYEEEAARFERAFYMAEQNGGNFQQQCKTTLPKLWSGLLQKRSPFPGKKELIQHKQFKTLEHLFDKFIDTSHHYEEDED